MPTLRVQMEDSNIIADANSYVTLEEFTTYADEHGFDISSYTEDEIIVALIKAQEFLDDRFSYIGFPEQDYLAQNTEFPRSHIYTYRSSRFIRGLPREVVQAQHELSLIHISEPTRPY